MSLLCACSSTPRHRPPPSEFNDDGFRAEMRNLAGEGFDGRMPGTAGAQKTVDYIVAEFKRFGLKPGNGDSYLQQVPIVEITAGADTSLSVSADGRAQSFVYGKDMVIWTARERGESAVVHSPMVFVGYGIVAPEFGWNDYAGIDVRGKTVVALAGDPGIASGDPKMFDGPAMTRYGLLDYKVKEAARHGAAGVLLIREAGAYASSWEAVVNAYAGSRLEAPAADGHAARAAIEGWLSDACARELFAQADLDFAAEASKAARRGFHAVPLGLYADAEVHNSLRTFDSPNVIAWLPGRRQRRETIIYTAHWDDLGHSRGAAGPRLLPGAVDNASGVAGLLLLAEEFSRTRPPPDRSIVFMAPTAAEYALLGSSYYVRHPLYPLRDTVADINLDQLHIGGPTRDLSVIGLGQSQLDRYASAAADLQGRLVHAEPNPQRGRFFRSDDFSFAEAGVPALYAVGGIDDTALGPKWGEAELDGYYAQRYRRAGDAYSAAWDVRGTLEDLHLYYEVGMRLAQTRRFPQWYATSEYRHARERSRGGTGD